MNRAVWVRLKIQKGDPQCRMDIYLKYKTLPLPPTKR